MINNKGLIFSELESDIFQSDELMLPRLLPQKEKNMDKQERIKQERAKLWIENPYVSIEETASFERTSDLIDRLGIIQLSLKANIEGLKELKADLDGQIMVDRHSELRAILRADGFRVVDPGEFKLAVENGRSI